MWPWIKMVSVVTKRVAVKIHVLIKSMVLRAIVHKECLVLIVVQVSVSISFCFPILYYRKRIIMLIDEWKYFCREKKQWIYNKLRICVMCWKLRWKYFFVLKSRILEVLLLLLKESLKFLYFLPFLDSSWCSNNKTCWMNGVCSEIENGFNCHCFLGFTGRRCEIGK